MATNLSADSLPDTPPPVYVWKFSTAFILLGIGLFAILAWLFWDGLWLEWLWWQSPEYGYAYLIPPIALFLIWQQKDRLQQVAFRGSWWGLTLVLIGGGLLLLGQLGTIYTLVQYAYFVTLFGLVLAFTGSVTFRRYLLMPLFILLFVVPMPEFLLANLSTRLQLLSSQIGVAFMRLFNVSVFLEGNVIDLGGYKLQVADACSGLRYLFPLMTLGFLMAYFYRGAMWKRVVIFLSSIPITVLMNSFRVGVIGITVDHWGIGMAEGFLHEFQGWMVFMLCGALMLVEISVLNRIGRESGTWLQLFGIELPAPLPTNALIRRRSIPTSFIVSGALVIVFLIVSVVVPRPRESYPERVSFIEFPLQLGSWRGKTEPMQSAYLDQLKLDDYILSNYVNDAGQSMNLYIAWYNSQRKGEAVHSPRACLPAGGWEMRAFGQEELPGITDAGHALRVNRAVVELGNERELVYYWFQQRGRVVTNEFVVKWYIFWDALTRHRTDGALVRLIMALPPGTSEADADRRLTGFAAQLVPMLPRFVPN